MELLPLRLIPGHIYPHTCHIGQATDLCGLRGVYLRENSVSVRMILPKTSVLDRKQRGADFIQGTSTCQELAFLACLLR